MGPMNCGLSEVSIPFIPSAILYGKQYTVDGLLIELVPYTVYRIELLLTKVSSHGKKVSEVTFQQVAGRVSRCANEEKSAWTGCWYEL